MACAELSPQLFVKSFFGTSISDAMAQARRELGSDALLLNTRESAPEALHLGRYEVVFGRYPEPLPSTADTACAPDAERGDELRRKIEEIHHLLTRAASPASSRNSLSALEEALVGRGLPLPVARDLADSVRQRMHKREIPEIGRARIACEPDPDALLFETVAELGSRFEVQPQMGRIAAFIGPPGAGKTTTLVKVALAQGLTAGRAVHLISTDTQRIGGAEQLRTYAAILGVPFHPVESAAGLDNVLTGIPESALILIDTPGFSAALLRELAGDLVSVLTKRQDIDTHLVLTASMRHEDLQAAFERYSVFQPRKLLFTRLDETCSYAAIFCEAARTRIPLSFFSTGQSIPEDLECASKMRVIESLVSQLPEVTEAVA
jgi:flagellar biosynthesis protein FlhF